MNRNWASRFLEGEKISDFFKEENCKTATKNFELYKILDRELGDPKFDKFMDEAFQLVLHWNSEHNIAPDGTYFIDEEANRLMGLGTEKTE